MSIYIYVFFILTYDTYTEECEKIHIYSVMYDYAVNMLATNVQDMKWNTGSSEAPLCPYPIETLFFFLEVTNALILMMIPS